MKRALIIGATSAIAEASARRLAAQATRFFLTGRDINRLDAVAADLRVRGAGDVTIRSFDATDLEDHASMLDAAWAALGEVDIVLIAHGTLPNQSDCDTSVDTAMREFSTNATSTIALCIRIAQRLRAPGTIAVISSVAGDRGRASNYLYGSAKAATTEFLSGLRQRLHPTGVNVLTIKPGFVDTPMTRAFRKGPLWASPDRVAGGIASAIQARRSVAYVPGFWWLIMTVIRHVPEALFKRLKL